MGTRGDAVSLAVVLVVQLVVTSAGIHERWLEGHQGYCGALRSTIARNHLAHRTLLPIKDPDPSVQGTPPEHHWHHPPVAGWLVAASFALFGESEAAARAVPAAFSLASVVLVWLLVRRRAGLAAATAAGLVFAAVPMQVEYGRLVNYEPLLLPLALAATWAHERALDKRAWRATAATTAFTLAAVAVDWPGALFGAVLAVHALLRGHRRHGLALGLATAAAAAALLGAMALLAPPGGLMHLHHMRSAASAFATLPAVTAERLLAYFTPLPLLLATFWQITAPARGRGGWPTLFLAWTAVYVVLFPQGALVHVFWLYGLLPWVAAGTGLALHMISRRRVALAAAAAAVFVATLVPGLEAAHLRSIGVKPPEKPSRGVPHDGRYDVVLLGQAIRAATAPGDVVALHQGVHDGPQLRHYAARRVVPFARSDAPPASARLLVWPTEALAPADLRALATRHAVTHVPGHVLVDRAPHAAPGLARRTFSATAPGLAWRHFHSRHYPPGALSADAP